MSGRVLGVTSDSVVIDVGGVGLQLLCPPAVVGEAQVGERAHLAATLVVREDSLTLYGFADSEQREAFDVLKSVTGIGPRIALAVLGGLTTEQLRVAVAAGDERALTAIPGIGRKGAQRLILELAGKLGPSTGESVDVRDLMSPTAGAAEAWREPVRHALVGLGWSGKEAEHAVATVAATGLHGEGSDVPEMLRLALRTMGRR